MDLVVAFTFQAFRVPVSKNNKFQNPSSCQKPNRKQKENFLTKNSKNFALGKTATVTQVIKTIQKESKPMRLPAFDYVDINGMRLTEPRQAYVQIYRQLTGKTLAWAQARDLLESRFTAASKKANRPTILLVDELDIICNRKQDVVYNLFDWTIRKGSRLIAITIANTMDLPERVLKLKVASRLGLTRITFQPYSFKQLQEVVMTRLAGSKCFMADAVQLVARYFR